MLKLFKSPLIYVSSHFNFQSFNKNRIFQIQANSIRCFASTIEKLAPLTLVNEQNGIRNIILNSPKNR